ncbi:E3 ubiquitin-protein ligase TRIM71-like [Antedon mediterranea]|uniref:E3 ubiquitin-protein ligase TRIM71-like n=1 Tax=Antedon mediterranea TaxID=105859 RepID=UPI003AF819EB
MASDAASKYEEEARCSIIQCTLCKQQYKDPRTLSCLHTFCLKCLRLYIEDLDGSKPKCTICGTEFSGSEKDIEHLQTDVLINRTLECKNEELSDQVCSLCDSEATEKCFHCNHCLCDRDADNHRKIPSTMNHTLVKLKEYQQMSASERLSLRPTKCSQSHHGDCTVDYFCSTCDTPVCIKCTLTDHDRTEHNLHSMNEVIETDKKELSEEQLFVATQYKQLTKAEKKIFETREKLTKAKEEAIKIITERSNDLRKHIDRLQNELADDITAKYNTKVNVLDKQLDDMDRRMNEMDMTTAYIDALMQCKNPEVFLDASKKWYEQFKEKKPDYSEVEVEPIENSYLRVELDEKPIDDIVKAELICTVFCTSAVGCHSQLNGCPDEAEIGSDVKFNIVIKDKNDSKVALCGTSPDVEITSPNDHKTVLNGETTSGSKFKYEWSPTSLGKHTLSVRLFNNDVKGSPKVISIYPKNSKGQHKNDKGGSNSTQKKSGSSSKHVKSEQRKAGWKK